MIKVIVKRENTNYKKITITGHAEYAKYGKDIVCSATSSIAITTVNGILLLNKDSLSYKQSEDGLEINVNSYEKTTQILLENMINMLMELEEEYPTNIKVK